MKFTTTIYQVGNNTGIEVTEEIIQQLNAGKKPLVAVSLNGYTYQSAIASMSGKYLISLSAENRKNANVKGGDEVEVTLELDTVPRTVTLPEDFEIKLMVNTKAFSFYETLAPSMKKKLVTLIESAKTEETRKKRIEKLIIDLSNEQKP